MMNLKAVRKAAGLSQIHLATTSGVSRFRISLAESGVLNLLPNEVEAINKAVAPEIEKTLRVASTFQNAKCVVS